MTRDRSLTTLGLRIVLGLLLTLGLILTALWAFDGATGDRAVVIRSGSMAPAIPAGSLAVIERVVPSAIVAGDALTIRLGSGTLMTHRVLQVLDIGGEPVFVLHGDANVPWSKDIVSAEQVVGRVRIALPGLGFVALWLGHPGGLFAYVSLVGLLIVVLHAAAQNGVRRRRDRRRWRSLRRTRFGRWVAMVEGWTMLGLHRPAFALLMIVVVGLAGRSTLASAALFSGSADVGGNAFTTGVWVGSNYRTVTSGNWGNASTWERFNGTSWVPATRPPETIDGTVTVRAGMTATVTTDVSADQVVVEAGAQLEVTPGVTTTVIAGSGTDLDVFGTVIVSGTLTLSGGGTAKVETAGILQVAGIVDGTGSLVGGGGAIQGGTTAGLISAPVTLTASLTASGTSDLTVGGVISGTGAITKTGTGTLTLAGTNTYTGITTVSAGIIRVQNAAALGTTAGATSIVSFAAIEIDGSGLVINETISSIIGTGVGATGAIRNIANANTWAGAMTIGSGNATVASDSGTLILGAVGGAARTLTVTGLGDTTIGGIIATTTGALTKNGTGTLTLGAANTYAGVTTINAGTVALTTTNAIGASSAVTVTSGAVLDLNGSSDTIGSLAGGGLVTSTASGLVTLTVGGNGVGTGVFSGVLQDGDGRLLLTKLGSGTLTLSGINTYTGATTISAGIVSISADSGLGTAPGTPTPGQLTIGTGTLTTTVGFTMDPNRGITISGGGTFTVTGTLTYNGIVAGAGTLSKAGTGTLGLGGVNTYAGATTISAGILSIAADSGLGTAPGTPTPGQLTMTGTTTLTTTAGFILDPSRGIAITGTGTFTPTGTLTVGGVISGTGAITKTGTGTLTLAGTNTYTGITTVSAGIIRVQNAAALGTTAGATSIVSFAAIEIDGSGLVINETISSIIGTGVGATGAIRNIANANTWAGAMTLGAGGATIASDGGTLTTAGVTGAGLPLTVTGLGDTTIGGIIATTTGALTKNGTGTLTLGAANTYAGVTTINAGKVRVQNATSLGTITGATTVASGAAIEIDGSGLVINETISSIIGTGVGATGAIRNIANANTWAGAMTLGAGGATIASDGGTLTTAGVTGAGLPLTVTGLGDTTIGGIIGTTTGTLTKTGAGTLTLGAANTYTGITTIGAGKVLVDGSTGTGAVSVAAGAGLGGSGTVGGAVSVTGQLAPGGSPGRLITGALTFVAGATFSLEIGGIVAATGYDQERTSSGAVTIGGSVTLSLVAIGGFVPTLGQTFTIVDKLAVGAIGGTFNGLAEGSLIPSFLGSGLSARISYVGGDGNDVVLTVVP